METTTTAQKHKAMAYMLLCALLWSIGGIFIKSIPWSSFAIAGARSLIAAMVIGCYIAIRRFRFMITKKTLIMMACLSMTYFAFITATKLTTAANAIVLQFTAPLYVLMYNGLFRKQKLHVADYVVVAVTILGVAVCFLGDLGQGGSLLGNLIALFSGITFAGMLISTGSAPEEERASGLIQGQALTALIGMPFFFAEGAQLTVTSGLCILALGVLQLGFAFVLYSLAARHCPPLACSLLGALEPLLNPIWVAVFAGEVPGALSLTGGLIVVLAVSLWCVYDDRRSQKEANSPNAAAA